MKLENKVFVICGGATGIGRATAILFAKEGAKVVVGDINDVEGERTLNMIKDNGGEAIYCHVDVSKPEDVKNIIDTAVTKYRGIDILHNNAYWAGTNSAIADITEEEWNKTIDITLKGVFLGCKYAIPEMIKKGGGVIINTASVAGMVNSPPTAAYCTAKAGVIQLTRTIAVDYGPKNIRANAICPGVIDTPATAPYFTTEEGTKLLTELSVFNRIGKPEDIAYLALYLASDESSFMTGSAVVIDGGWTAR
jgi:NAD(P)-dependent dehydrogenase (short-subunit alcohol dehydrogenase family)